MFYRTWTVLRVTALWRDGTSGTASPAVLGSGVGARALSLLCSPATCYGACAITAPSSPRSVNYQWNRYIGMREYFGLFIYTACYMVCVLCRTWTVVCVTGLGCRWESSTVTAAILRGRICTGADFGLNPSAAGHRAGSPWSPRCPKSVNLK